MRPLQDCGESRDRLVDNIMRAQPVRNWLKMGEEDRMNPLAFELVQKELIATRHKWEAPASLLEVIAFSSTYSVP